MIRQEDCFADFHKAVEVRHSLPPICPGEGGTEGHGGAQVQQGLESWCRGLRVLWEENCSTDDHKQTAHCLILALETLKDN